MTRGTKGTPRLPVVEQARVHGLGDLPRRSAARYPHKLAVVDGDVRLTFADFDRRVDEVAAGLSRAGLTKGDTLALLAHNCWQFAVLAFATARLGVVLVPVNFMLRAAEIAYILDHSDSDAFVVEDALVAVAEEALAQSRGRVRLTSTIRLGSVATAQRWTDFADLICTGAKPPAVTIEDEAPLRLMYTSGTESRPKGVLLSSRCLMWQYMSCIVTGGMESSDVELHSLPLYHCAQLDNFLVTDIYLGATSVIVPGPDPARILETIERERITNLFCPPTIWISLLRHPDFDSFDLSSLRKGYYGASAMPTEILKEMGERLPGLRLWNFYGQTELASLATALPPEEQAEYPGSAGRPVLNVETCILDEVGAPVATGVVGEIVHRSPQITLGYFRDSEKTAEAFAGGWFHSGDLGYFDEGGRLYVVDRKKDMIKTGGENVASREVEEAIYAHEDVEEVAVFGVDHPTWVEAVTAAVVLREGRTVDPDAIIAHSRRLLAGFKTPKYVVVVEQLPKNPSGKILKRTLRETYGALATDEVSGDAQSTIGCQ